MMEEGLNVVVNGRKPKCKSSSVKASRLESDECYTGDVATGFYSRCEVVGRATEGRNCTDVVEEEVGERAARSLQ